MEDLLAYIIGVLLGIIIILTIVINVKTPRSIENTNCIYYEKEIYCKGVEE